MQLDILPELPPNGGYENIITAIDVFSRYAFADLVSNPTAVDTEKVNIDIKTRHAFLHTLIKTEKAAFGLPSYTRSSGNTTHKFETNHNKTCTNNQGPRAGPCHNQNSFENGIGRIQETMAPIYTQCNPELQHDLPFQYFQILQYTKANIS